MTTAITTTANITGGNILTAAIKTATVGLAAGAGLLYKTFMDTSDAFRQLAQAGLGGAGASGTESSRCCQKFSTY